MKFTYDINNMREVFGTDVPEELAKRIKEYFSGEGIDVNVITTDDAVTVEFTPPYQRTAPTQSSTLFQGCARTGDSQKQDPFLMIS